MLKMLELPDLALTKEDKIGGDKEENDDGDAVVIKRNFKKYVIMRLGRVVLGEG